MWKEKKRPSSKLELGQAQQGPSIPSPARHWLSLAAGHPRFSSWLSEGRGLSGRPGESGGRAFSCGRLGKSAEAGKKALSLASPRRPADLRRPPGVRAPFPSALAAPSEPGWERAEGRRSSPPLAQDRRGSAQRGAPVCPSAGSFRLTRGGSSAPQSSTAGLAEALRARSSRKRAALADPPSRGRPRRALRGQGRVWAASSRLRSSPAQRDIATERAPGTSCQAEEATRRECLSLPEQFCTYCIFNWSFNSASAFKCCLSLSAKQVSRCLSNDGNSNARFT